MPMILPHTLLFSTTLMLGTIIALSSSNLFIMWVGMELNLLSFIPMILTTSTQQETEASVKYFIAQVWGSSLFLLALSTSTSLPSSYLTTISTIMIMSAFMTKAGMAPFHFWFPSVMMALSWVPALILTTLQKLIPLILLFNALQETPQISMPLSLASAFIGSLGGLNLSSLRPILAYSSISHMGWMTAISSLSFTSAVTYLSMYILLIAPIFILLAFFNSPSTKTTNLMQILGPMNTLILFIMVLSLAGMPPTTGFAMKLIALKTLVQASSSLIIPILFLVSATINLLFYLNITFYTLITSMTAQKKSSDTLTPSSPILLSIVMMNLMIIPMIFIF